MLGLFHAADDWFTESADGKFGLKDASVLDPASPMSAKPIFESMSGLCSAFRNVSFCKLTLPSLRRCAVWSVCPSHQLSFLHMGESLKTGRTGTLQGLGTENVWDWFAKHPDLKMRFAGVRLHVSILCSHVQRRSLA